MSIMQIECLVSSLEKKVSNLKGADESTKSDLKSLIIDTTDELISVYCEFKGIDYDFLTKKQRENIIRNCKLIGKRRPKKNKVKPVSLDPGTMINLDFLSKYYNMDETKVIRKLINLKYGQVTKEGGDDE